MKIQEHNDYQFTKQRTSIEKYLTRIIQRYFDIENNLNNEHIEAIIVESLTRLKRDLAFLKGFVFNVNGKTGDITLDISDFYGEYAFDKKTAFNKNFGNKENTICEGNDDRLYDKRNPLQHCHVISNVKELENLLNQNVIHQNSHNHLNQNTIDIIKYTGNKIYIDLAIIEHLSDKIKEYSYQISTLKTNVILTHQNNLKPLVDILEYVKSLLEKSKLLLSNLHNWVITSNNYVDEKSNFLIDYFNRLISNCITEKELNDIIQNNNNFYYLVNSGEIVLDETSMTINAEESNDFVAGDGDAESLEDIYNNGETLGNANWVWDADKMSFVYQQNENSYSVLLSKGSFENYTHRVTLLADDSDDDLISVVLAYDKETNSHLSLICSVGGITMNSVPPYPSSNKPVIAVVYNYKDIYSFTPLGKLFNNLSNERTQWNALNNGISVLIKREKNIFKIWAIYNKQHNWNVIEINGRNDIITYEKPLFEFNLNDYTETKCFVNKKCQYGYGCFSQMYSMYQNVFFNSSVDTNGFSDKQGHTDIYINNNKQYAIPNDIFNDLSNYGSCKMFFRYDKDNQVITLPLPYIMIENDNIITCIHGSYDNGTINISASVINTISDYITEDNIYNNDVIIIPSSNKDYYYNILNKIQLSNINYCLSLINDENKYTFVKSLLKDNIEYYIQGMQTFELDEDTGKLYYLWIDNNHEVMNFFDWEVNHPLNFEPLNLYINENRKMASDDIYTDIKRGAIIEYTPSKLSDYYNNPRIYYQIQTERE